MYNQHVAKILFCGMCITPFSNYADFLPSEFGGFKYATAEHNDFNNNPSDVSGIPLNVLDIYMTSNDRNKFVRKNQLTIPQTKKVQLGLKSAINYLRNNNLNRRVVTNSINVSHRELANTASELMRWQGTYSPEAMRSRFKLMDLSQKSKVKSKFTGYYTPTISAQLYSNSEYRYPIYKSPMSNKRFLSRKQIAEGALANQGLEIAWTNDPVGLFYMHIQGSGVLQLSNGERKSLKFNGSNEKRFQSVARYMQNRGLINGNPSRSKIKQWLDRHPHSMTNILNINPRFIYFTLNKGAVKTASGIPVLAGHTVAVDTDYIPFGSVILAEVPITSSVGQIIGREWRLLFPQDRGNAIKGPARMDIYTGAGETARKMANNLTGYGKAYLLLNKSKYEQTLTASLGN